MHFESASLLLRLNLLIVESLCHRVVDTVEHLDAVVSGGGSGKWDGKESIHL